MVRFLADASLRHAIVSGCLRREPTIDFLSVNMAHSWGVWVWYYIETRIEDNRMGLWAHIEPESVACGAQCST